ncbi:hypothetical protein PAHAL_1G173400 [Panicum hallii]|jgi:hypothetical protein|uniref:Uncharacterized protein n=1 Tax=Panicum hallii TaxID=206008 RepID=A0A2T8KVN8_9POAL|nr:hypothetical protein PAHAL_1G173400 [Panicum hallii]
MSIFTKLITYLILITSSDFNFLPTFIFLALIFHGQGDTICGTNSREVQLEWTSSRLA